ncbi:MAG: prenyltransferase/squalene oxidase repeat-containing protein [Promethearchaeota archaeon]
MNKNGILVGFLVLVLFLGTTMPFAIATETQEQEIEDAIVAGLNWLANHQDDEGYWGFPDRVGKTGLALLKFEERAKELGYDSPFNPEYIYSENVEKGFQYIFRNVYMMDTDDPDTEPDALYIIDFEGWANYVHYVYEHSIAMMAIAASGTPDRVVDVTESPVYGWTFEEVMQFAINYLLYCQKDEGGWSYSAPGQNMNWMPSDNSNTGYAVLAMTYAQTRFGLSIPEGVKVALSEFIDYIQTDPDDEYYDVGEEGGSGYRDPGLWVNILKTGNLLYEMAFVGDTMDSERAQAALDFIERYWDDPNWSPGWRGPGWEGEQNPDYQTMYTAMKGFLAMGIEAILVGDIEVDWFDDFVTAILDTQNEDGSWPWDEWGDPFITTSWALLTLEKAVEIPTIEVSIDIKPESWPNPINILSQGKFAVAICGTEDFDVHEIDPASISISIDGVEDSVYPLFWSYQDVATPYILGDGGGHEEGSDGYIDLVLHFWIPEVVITLDLEDHAGETVSLIASGYLKEDYGGTPIHGEDLAWILT